MTRLPSFPKIDLTSFDLNKLRSIELPTFDLPKFDLPNLDLASVNDKLVETAKNAAYFTVGLAAAAVERVAKLAA